MLDWCGIECVLPLSLLSVYIRTIAHAMSMQYIMECFKLSNV